MMVKKIMSLIIFFIGAKAFCQHDEELFVFDYFMGISKENESTNTSNTRITFNIPTIVGKSTLIHSLQFENYKFNYDEQIAFNTSDIENIKSLSYGLTLKYPLDEEWHFTIHPNISMTSNHLTFTNELLLTGGVAIHKSNLKSETEIGIGYYTFLGKPRILPKIKYTKKVADNFAYTVGFPQSNVTYNYDTRSSFVSELNFKGTYAYINKPIVVDNSPIDKIEYSVVTFGLKYIRKLDLNWSFFIQTGGILYNDYDLTKNTALKVDIFRAPFISSGVTFNLNRK